MTERPNRQVECKWGRAAQTAGPGGSRPWRVDHMTDGSESFGVDEAVAAVAS